MFNQEELFNFNFKERWRELLMGVFLLIGLCSIFFGLWLAVTLPKKENKVVLSQIEEPSREEIVVEIAGAVENPGTYLVGEGSRISDLVRKSGGFSKNADTSYIASELNLAQKLSDEDKIYIKFLGEKDISSKSNDDIDQSNDAQISINNASQSQLEELEGVGEKRASEIILQRPYQSLEDLVTKSIISETIFKNNKGRIKL